MQFLRQMASAAERACGRCGKGYNEDRLQLVIPCGHTLCAKCVLLAPPCPHCGTSVPRARQFALNRSLADQLGLMGQSAGGNHSVAAGAAGSAAGGAAGVEQPRKRRRQQARRAEDLSEDEPADDVQDAVAEEEHEEQQHEEQDEEQGEEQPEQDAEEGAEGVVVVAPPPPRGHVLLQLCVVDPGRLDQHELVLELWLPRYMLLPNERQRAYLPMTLVRRQLRGRGVPREAWRLFLFEPGYTCCRSRELRPEERDARLLPLTGDTRARYG